MAYKCLDYSLQLKLKAFGDYNQIKRYDPKYIHPKTWRLVAVAIILLLVLMFTTTIYVSSQVAVISVDSVCGFFILTILFMVSQLIFLRSGTRKSVSVTDKGIILLSKGDIVFDVIQYRDVLDVKVWPGNRFFNIEYDVLQIKLRNSRGLPIYIRGIQETTEIFEFIINSMNGGNDITQGGDESLVIQMQPRVVRNHSIYGSDSDSISTSGDEKIVLVNTNNGIFD